MPQRVHKYCERDTGMPNEEIWGNEGLRTVGVSGLWVCGGVATIRTGRRHISGTLGL